MRKCPVCGRWFKNYHALNIHIGMNHKEQNEEEE